MPLPLHESAAAGILLLADRPAKMASGGAQVWCLPLHLGLAVLLDIL